DEDVKGGGFTEVALAGESFQPAREAIGLYGPGVDGIHLDVVADAEIRHGLGEGKQCGVDGAADGELRAGRASARSGDIHEGARAGAETRPGKAGETHGAEELES